MSGSAGVQDFRSGAYGRGVGEGRWWWCCPRRVGHGVRVRVGAVDVHLHVGPEATRGAMAPPRGLRDAGGLRAGSSSNAAETAGPDASWRATRDPQLLPRHHRPARAEGEVEGDARRCGFPTARRQRPPPPRRPRLPPPPADRARAAAPAPLARYRAGVGLITVGVERHGMRLSMSHIADGEWRAVFMGENALLAPRGYGVAPTPWGAVQRAAWELWASSSVKEGCHAEPARHPTGHLNQEDRDHQGHILDGKS